MGIPGLNFVAIDFETANNYRASVCAVGLAWVEDGEVVEQRSWLIRPFASVGEGKFGWRQVAIHGIKPDMVASSPTFTELYPELKDVIGKGLLVAHNASFDRSCMAKACAASGLTSPPNAWACTMVESRRVLPALPNHKLPTVARALNVQQLHHHDAGDDALVAARVRIELAQLKIGPR